MLLLPALSAADRPLRTSPFDRVIAQVAAGGGWQTAIHLLNMESAAVPVKVVFRTPEGAAWQIPLVDRGTSSQFDLTLQPGQTILLTTGDLPALQQGWARLEVDCCKAVGGFAVFRQRVAARPDFEAVVPLGRPSDASFLIYDNSAGFTTGLAIANGYAGVQTSLLIRVYDAAGSLLTTRDLNLAQDGRAVINLPQLIPETAGRRGSLEISSAGAFVVLGLRFQDAGSFTSFSSFEPEYQ